jgi:hypothetical protein
MERGEWWLDDMGQTTFADGDVGDVNHEGYAFQCALGLDDDDEVDRDIMERGGFDAEQEEILRARGVDETALTFFKKRNADARDYAVKYMGWIRVKGPNAQMWKLDDKSLKHIQRAEFWDEEDAEDRDQEMFVEEASTGKTWSIPFKTLLDALSAEGLKNWMAGTGKFHGLGSIQATPFDKAREMFRARFEKGHGADCYMTLHEKVLWGVSSLKRVPTFCVPEKKKHSADFHEEYGERNPYMCNTCRKHMPGRLL